MEFDLTFPLNFKTILIYWVYWQIETLVFSFLLTFCPDSPLNVHLQLDGTVWNKLRAVTFKIGPIIETKTCCFSIISQLVFKAKTI